MYVLVNYASLTKDGLCIETQIFIHYEFANHIFLSNVLILSDDYRIRVGH